MESSPVKPYTPREFYGPLEIIDNLAQRENVEFYKHPENENRLIRFERTSFASKDEMEQSVADMRELLDRMTSYGIAHVNPEFFDNTYQDDGKLVLGITVDAIHEHHTFNQLLDDRRLSDDELYEADKTIAAICSYIADTEQSGGIIAHDALTPRQFVYVPDNESGKKFVLVDIEPIALERLEPGKESRHLVTLFVDLFEDIIKVKFTRPEAILICESAVIRMIDAIPISIPNAAELKESLAEAWSTGSIERFGRYIDENTEDESVEEGL